MSERKKYKMRPARKNAKGELQAVPIGYYRGKLSALQGEGEYLVTPTIHRAYMAGDIDIDGYPHERPAGVAKTVTAKPKKKRSKSKPKAETKPAEATKPEPKPEASDSE